ncbi:nuclear transport factor 2 family protein [Nocardioides zeicaulis]
MARMSTAADALARWHAVVASRDAAGLPALVADDAVFRSPAVHAPQEGRDTVVGYLTAAFTVLGPELTYEREWLGDDSAVLEFRTRVGGYDVSGIDMITWDADGRIVDFTVMVRPKRALDAVVEHMGAELLRMLEAAPRS